MCIKYSSFVGCPFQKYLLQTINAKDKYGIDVITLACWNIGPVAIIAALYCYGAGCIQRVVDITSNIDGGVCRKVPRHRGVGIGNCTRACIR